MGKRVMCKSVSQKPSACAKNVGDEVSAEKEMATCIHVENTLDLTVFISKLESLKPVCCEDCRDGSRSGNKQVQKRSDTETIWICVECGHFSCGGVEFPKLPKTHAARHAKLACHPLSIQFKNRKLLWCFMCNKHIQKDRGGNIETLSDIVDMMKEGILANEVRSENATEPKRNVGYVVRGMVNLGNTCYFNSIMQNLLSFDKLRDYFFKLDGSAGSLIISFKELFLETKSEGDVINPKSVFDLLGEKLIQFQGSLQQDSHELLRCLLDLLFAEEMSMKTAVNISQNDVPTYMNDIFKGQTSSTIICLECGHCSTVCESFLDLSLPVPTKRHQCKKPQSVHQTKKMKFPARRGLTFCTLDKSTDAEAGQSSPKPSTVAENMVDTSTLSDTIGPAKELVSNSILSDYELAKQIHEADAEFDDFIWRDYLEPDPLSVLDDSMALQNGDFIANQDFDDKWEAQNGQERMRGGDEASSPFDDERDSDLFNVLGTFIDMPELCEDHNLKPLDCTSIIQSNEVDGAGLLSENSCESEAGDVDNTSFMVSVESCLDLYTKVEILSDEHSWHCQNCSKIVRQQKIEFRKKTVETKSKARDLDTSEDRSDSSEDTHSNVLDTPDGSLVSQKSIINDSTQDPAEPKRNQIVKQDAASETISIDKPRKLGRIDEPGGNDNRRDSQFSGKSGVNESMKVMSNATKRILITRAPQILTIHLKRFNQNEVGSVCKLNGHVDFKDTIDLRPYMGYCEEGEEYNYSLIGVVEHLGSMRRGHYVSYVRGYKNGYDGDLVWYYISDAFVKKVSLEEVIASNAYILFYQREV